MPAAMSSARGSKPRRIISSKVIRPRMVGRSGCSWTFDMQLERIDDYRWLIPRTYKSGMLTDALVYARERLLEAIGAISLFPTSPYSFPEAWEQRHTSSWAR